MFYWRCDEGKGQIINDMTDNELHTQLLEDQTWGEQPLEDG